MLEPGGAGPRPEWSIRPRLFRAPAGRHQTCDDCRSLARVGYEAGDRIVPSRRPGAGASRLRPAAAARLERGAVIVAIAVTDDLGFRAEHRSDPSRPSPARVRPSSTSLGESAFQGNPLVSDPPELRGIDRAVRDQAHERVSISRLTREFPQGCQGTTSTEHRCSESACSHARRRRPGARSPEV
jgi:hypothetical protein